MTRKSERKRIRKELWVKYLKENPTEGYDVISKRVNESYAETHDIRETMTDTGLPTLPTAIAQLKPICSDKAYGTPPFASSRFAMTPLCSGFTRVTVPPPLSRVSPPSRHSRTPNQGRLDSAAICFCANALGSATHDPCGCSHTA